MMSLQKPPLTRSDSSPSAVDSTNRTGPSVAPPTSLNLRSSHNQSLGRNLIKEGVLAKANSDVKGSSSSLSKNRQRYAITTVQNAMGPSENLQNYVTPKGCKAAPTKSLSSSSLCSSASSISLSTSNPKLAKNGTNLQLKAEEEQHGQKDKNQRSGDIMVRSSSDWMEGKDNQNYAPMRRRTKSFLEYHREESMVNFSVKEEKEGKGEEEEEKEEQTEKHLLPKLHQQDWVKENRVEVHLTLPQKHLLLAKDEEDDSPTQAQLKGMERYDHQPQKEPLTKAMEIRGEVLTTNQLGLQSSLSPRHHLHYQPTPASLSRLGLLAAREEDPEMEEKEEEGDEDSSWTTLSQESPSLGTPQDAGGIWNDADTPQGQCEKEDSTEVYFWHVPSSKAEQDHPVSSGNRVLEPDVQRDGHGAASLTVQPPKTQVERPSSIVSDSSVEPVPSSAASSPSSNSLSYEIMVPSSGFLNNNYLSFKETVANADASLRECERGSVRLKLQSQAECITENSPRTSIDLDDQVFPVSSLGWMEVDDQDLVAGRSGLVVSDCIRQLQFQHRDSSGEREEGKPMLLVLQDLMLTLVDPTDHALLYSQPIGCIQVWGVGQDHSRDFAYVARDKNTRVLKCHVFRCDVPAEAIATSLQRICSKIMAERKNAKAASGSTSNTSTDVPLREFPTPKTDQDQRFHVLYLGMTSVSRPIGMDIINGAIDSLISSTGKEDWAPVILNVADATVCVIKEKEEDEEVVVDCRVRFLSFMGVGRDVHTFAFIMDTGNQHFQCHAFWCEPNAGNVSEAVQSACVLRYQKCLVARSPSQKAGSSSPPPSDSVTRRVTTSVKRGVQSLIDTLKQKKPAGELPHQ
ncbi:amyloid-beta A4 precursor protein-binding family B member 2-like isoform X2 [Denticeps clupeoides]|uniref:PID domain-containing protein n=1 Tax=Denticeps clupeoides TaxID=299321 RepID=A0AAY4EE36_9TELE|nr:amyloid-beta A4 precursor protein-binding family B member 2-like isoform X2 [Denticeps clupeoides]